MAHGYLYSLVEMFDLPSGRKSSNVFGGTYSVFANGSPSILRAAGSWNSVLWVLKHSGIELHQLICDKGWPFILIVYLEVHQILQFGSLLTSRPIRALSWCD